MRVLFHIDDTTRIPDIGTKGFEFFINMPGRVNRKDLVRLEELIDEDNFTEQQLTIIYQMGWEVSLIIWGKDKDGIYQIAHLDY